MRALARHQLRLLSMQDVEAPLEAPVAEPVEEAPVAEAPVEEAPAAEAPVEEAPAAEAQAEEEFTVSMENTMKELQAFVKEHPELGPIEGKTKAVYFEHLKES